MKRAVFTTLLTLFISIAYAETVTTTDGRTIVLNKDGTYQIQGVKTSSSDSMVEVSSHLFEHNVDKYSQKTIRFMPIFTNKSDKNIIALKFTTKFLDPFGRVVLEMNGDSEEKINSKKKSTANLFYVFKDNQFIDGENYDKLLSTVTNGTGSIKTSVTAIVFEGGEVIKLQ
ncbi:hypothetical protein PSEHALCIP103_02680 [Pseudoalteromonas haloplanktis]|uniref:Uncharacterized protein n=1 Tax=Pseudoalteromonas haloplanktis TaxID=228 RepID=A0A9W4R1M7_PSEHA|nr:MULTISPECIES: hypothetical protein [Pseudoalteromonas]EWS96840.1 hypothetical protein BG00_16475 [Pseudoalteromonas sp. SCSIO_11900]TMS62188.1 hypothetical protein CWC10_07910 [Pseudoalteromonas sp. S3173]CAH9062325.1 hypothetical protein PSEHALCIP103_02680 [Pseudoalteromonas haloplanktis]